MEEYFEILSRCPLFHRVERGELGDMLSYLRARTLETAKGEPVFLEGDPAKYVGVVLEGAVQIVREDLYGNRSVLTVVQPGGLFAEAFVCAGLDTMPVSVLSQQPGKVLLLELQEALKNPGEPNRFQSKLVGNLLRVMAQKNLGLTQKIRCMSPKTTREKLMAFLLEEAKKQDAISFTIPFDRQALADYLGVDRSAMSAELGKLKKAGVLDTKGSWFCLKQRGDAIE